MNFIRGLFIRMGVFGAILFTFCIFCLGGIALHYDVTFWMNFFHHPMHGNASLLWIVCLIAGLFVGTISIPVAIVTFILSFFL